MLHTQIIDCAEGFAALRTEWNELLRQSVVDGPFLTWEWLYTWWCHLAEDRKLAIVCVRRNGLLIGIAPLALRPCRLKRLLPFRALEFLGTGNVGSDYLDLILRRGYEQEAAGAVAEVLRGWNLMLQLSNAERNAPGLLALQTQLGNAGWHTVAVPVDRCPYIDLRGCGWQSYLVSLGPSHRSNLKRRLRNLHRSFQIELHTASTDVERRDILNTLVELHLQRWSSHGGSNALHTRALRDFHEEWTRLALEQGWLRLTLLTLDCKPASAYYGLKYAGRFYYYQAGYDTAYSKFSVGLVGLGLMIRQALAEGCAEFDFLHGQEPYKYLWANGERELVRYDWFLPHRRGRLYRQGMDLRAGVKRVLTPMSLRHVKH